MPSYIIQTIYASELILIVLLELSQVLKESLVAWGMVVRGGNYPNLLANLQLTQSFNLTQTS